MTKLSIDALATVTGGTQAQTIGEALLDCGKLGNIALRAEQKSASLKPHGPVAEHYDRMKGPLGVATLACLGSVSGAAIESTK